MSLRCKKGDLAIVLRGKRAGYVVEVLDFIGRATGLESRKVYDDIWAVKVSGKTHGRSGRRFGERDTDLLPIRPGDLQETEESEKEIERV